MKKQILTYLKSFLLISLIILVYLMLPDYDEAFKLTYLWD